MINRETREIAKMTYSFCIRLYLVSRVRLCKYFWSAESSGIFLFIYKNKFPLLLQNLKKETINKKLFLHLMSATQKR